MIPKLLDRWCLFVINFFCGNEPDKNLIDHQHKLADEINGDIAYWWAEIDSAEYHYHFLIIEIGIEEFAEKYKGIEKIGLVIRDLQNHLSERIETVQQVWSIH